MLNVSRETKEKNKERGKNMIETIIYGYFTKEQCEQIIKKMQGKSLLRFEISYSNNAGDCTLIVRSNTPGYTSQELKKIFIYCCISELANNK